MKKAPCKDCPDRRVGCHSECNKYKEWCLIHQKELDTIYAAKKEEAAFIDYKRKVSKRLRKRRGL